MQNIAYALGRLADIQEARFKKEYPERPINEPTIAQANYKKPQAEEPDPDQEWIGPREKKALARIERQARRGADENWS